MIKSIKVVHVYEADCVQCKETLSLESKGIVDFANQIMALGWHVFPDVDTCLCPKCNEKQDK